jgi:hypothetical protein
MSSFVAVKGCIKHLFRGARPYGKTPWFSRCGFFPVADVDLLASSLPFADVGVFHE